MAVRPALMARVPFLMAFPDAGNATVADTAIGLGITAEHLVNLGLTAMRQSAEVLQNRAGDHHVRISRGNASGRRTPGAPVSRLSTKKLAKVAAKFDFAARMRMGGVLFVGEGNLSFALTMSRKPRVPTSSILATVYEAEEDLTNTANEESAADGHTAFATFVFSG